MSTDMGELTWLDTPPLRRSLLLVGFRGLFDAAEAASDALSWIVERTDSQQIAAIDPELFYNFQEARPSIRFADDGSRVIDWPEIEIHAVSTDSVRDLVVMVGVEPHLRWSTFADYVLEVARRTGCEMVVTVGAFIGMVPHSRPFSVVASAAHQELARRLNLNAPTYEGPTGVIGVINERLERSEIPVISLRVEVPHYVPAPPNPKATRALLRRLQNTTGVKTGYEDLDADVVEWSHRVDEAVEADEESRVYVSRLEQQADSNEAMLPSGDDLAAELEAFLRGAGQSHDEDITIEPTEPSEPPGPASAESVEPIEPSGPASAESVEPSGPASAESVEPSGPASAESVEPIEPSGPASAESVEPIESADPVPGESESADSEATDPAPGEAEPPEEEAGF